MSWLQDQKIKLHRYFLRQALASASENRFSLPYGSIRRIGIFFDASDLDERESVLRKAKQWKSDGKQVQLLGYFDPPVENPNYTFPHFNRKDLDWALRPKKKLVLEFIDQPFDLLLLAFPQSHFLAEYIGALSKAHMRLGPASEHTQSYDIMIDSGSTHSVSQFLEQAEQLLKKTIKTHEAAGI
jgi:hypothetical protein